MMAVEDAGLARQLSAISYQLSEKDFRPKTNDYLTAGGVIIGSSRGG